MPYDDMDNQIQWMVFKVKQRARGDYFEDVENKGRSMPFYTYNWPYDFCSLVELAQLEVSMDFKKTPDTRKVRAKRVDLPDELALADRGAGGSGFEELSVSILGETVRTDLFSDREDLISQAEVTFAPTTGPQIIGPGGVLDAETAAGQSAGELMDNLEGGRMARSQTGDAVDVGDGAAVGQIGAGIDEGAGGDGDGFV